MNLDNRVLASMGFAIAVTCPSVASAQSAERSLGVSPRTALEAQAVGYPLISETKSWTVEGEAITDFSRRRPALGEVDAQFTNLYGFSGRYTLPVPVTLESTVAVEHAIPFDDEEEAQLGLTDIELGANARLFGSERTGTDVLVRGIGRVPTSNFARNHFIRTDLRARIDARQRVGGRVVLALSAGGRKMFHKYESPREIAENEPDSLFAMNPPPGPGGMVGMGMAPPRGDRPPPIFPSFGFDSELRAGISIIENLNVVAGIRGSMMVTYKAGAPPAGAPPPPGGFVEEGERIQLPRTQTSLEVNYQALPWLFFRGGVNTNQPLRNPTTDELNNPFWDTNGAGLSAFRIAAQAVF